MKIRVTRQPAGNINGISLRHYRPGHAYELPPNLAEYLVIQGFALFEMRTAVKDRRTNRLRSERSDRRQPHSSRFRADARA
jgi:hypothetical protein